MKKFIKIIVLFVVIALGYTAFFTASAATTTTAPDNVITGKATLMDKYLGDITISYKTLKDGSIYYCTQFSKDIPEAGITMTKVSPMDAGMTYIIANGYPNKSITGDNEKDFFITQLAVWWYQDIQTGSSSDVLINLKAGKYDDTTVGKEIIALKNGALAAKEKGYVQPSISINAKDVEFKLDKGEYISDELSVDATALSGKYTVSLVGAPEGTYIVNSNDDQQVKFDKDEKFRVIIPEEKASAKMNFSVKVAGISSVKKAYKYKAADSAIQNIALGTLYQEKKDMSATATFTVTTTKEEIEDPSTSDEKEETITKEETIVVTEIITNKQVFEDVVEEQVIVPDTASTVSNITYVLGGVMAILGTGLVIKNVKKA